MKTKEEIVEIVVDHYKTHPRSIKDDGGCVYTCRIDGQKCHCAVGLFLKNEYQKVGWDYNYSGVRKVVNVEGMPLEDILIEGVPRSKGDMDFWINLQTLHDEDSHWCKNNLGGCDLTKDGLQHKNRVLKKVKNGEL